MNDFNQYAKTWHQPHGPMQALHHIHPIRMSFIQEFLSKPPLKILDAGCAGGLISLDLAKLGHQVTGVDLSPDLIEQARIKSDELKLNIQWVNCALESFEPNEKYDMVICSEVLEHVTDPLQITKRLISHLNPDGTIIISTINRTLTAFASAILGAEYLLQIIPKGTHRYDGFIDSKQLIYSIEETGLILKRLSGICYNPLTYSAQLTRDTSVNYILSAQYPRPSSPK